MTPTPETDAAKRKTKVLSRRTGLCRKEYDGGELTYVEVEVAQRLERERDEARKAYQTVKEWAHRVEDTLNTILDRCCDMADGTPDATDTAKFANELVGLNNSVALGDVMSLRAERDQLRKVADALAASLLESKASDWNRKQEALSAYNELPHVKAKGQQ